MYREAFNKSICFVKAAIFFTCYLIQSISVLIEMLSVVVVCTARFIQDMKSFARAKSQNVIFTRGSGEKDSVKIILISLEALIR